MIEVEIKICEDEFFDTRTFPAPGVYMHTFDITAFPAVEKAYPKEFDD